MRSSVPERVKRPLKRALALAYGTVASPDPGLRVLLYHSIGRTDGSLSPAAFEDQLRYLRDTATVVSPRMIPMAKEPADHSVMLTFDDGYRDNLEIAAPLLSKYGFEAAFFVVTSLMDGSYSPVDAAAYRLYPGLELMNWDHLRELQRSGMDVGAHTVSHVDLAACSQDRTRSEIVESVGAVRQHLGQQRVLFAYPFGQKAQVTKTARAALTDSNVTFAFTTMWGTVTNATPPLMLPRLSVGSDETMADFRAKLSGAWDYLGWFHRIIPSS